jgi:hypothetical protein
VTATPGQAAYEHRLALAIADGRTMPSWASQTAAWRQGWEDTAQVGHAAIAAQEPHAAPGESPEQAWERRTQAAGTAPRALRAELETQVRSWLHNAEDAYGDDDSAAAAKDAFGQCAAELSVILEDHPEPKPAPELAQLRELLRLNRQLVVTLWRISGQQEAAGHPEGAYATGCAATMVEALWPVCNEQCTDTTHHQAQPAPELAAALAGSRGYREALQVIAGYAAGTATKQMIGTTARRALDGKS